MMPYPHVLSEQATLDQVLAGRSLARYGDGEFHLCRGVSIPCQRRDPALQARLQGILKDSGDCLVGIPNIESATPKTTFWNQFRRRADLLSDRPYVSAFVSRPDSAPWIDTPTYWAALSSLWVGQDVTLVRGSARSLTARDLQGACYVHELIAPAKHAWSYYATVMDRIDPRTRVLLCLGPTATVLAVDLCTRGVHVVDLGHVGMFLRKHLRGEPMTVTPSDKVAA
jgi:hypothetical protein